MKNTKKIYKLEKIITKLPLTNDLFIKKYGEKALKQTQYFIKRKDAIEFSKKIFIDLDGWKKEDFEINFTFDNGKLDGIPAIAFSPFITCLNEKCLKICYGTNQKFLSFIKFFYQIENTFFYLKHPDLFIKKFDAFLSYRQPRYFRFFENGDLINLKNMIDFEKIAVDHPETKFLLMTKKTNIANEFLKTTGGKYTKNLTLRFSNSNVKSCKISLKNPFSIPETEIVEKKSPIGENSTRCPGSKFGCLSCLKCWLSKLNVEFEIHR